MSINGMDAESLWQHDFAAKFFDNSVNQQLTTYHKRLIDEDRLWEIAYDNAINAYKTMKGLSPEEAAVKAINRLLTETRKV